MPVLSFIQTSITLGNLGVIAAIVGGFLALWSIGPLGGSTVELWQSRCEILERELGDAKTAVIDLSAKNDSLTAASHASQLAVKDCEKRIAELEARPDTQTMLDTFEMNQTAVLRVLGDLAAGVETLIKRDQTGRTTD